MTSPRALNCPLCGGTVSPPLSSRRMECRYCGKPLFYRGEEFLPRYFLASKLDEAALHQACRALFKSHYVPQDMARRALLLQKRRTYIPFYLLTGKRGGVIAAGRERVVERHNPLDRIEASLAVEHGPMQAGQGWRLEKPEIVTEEDSRVVLGDFQYLYPACTLENLDVPDLDLRETILEHLSDASPVYLVDLVRSGDVLDADIPLERIVEKGVASNQRTGELAVLEMQTVLLYVPLLTLTFRYGRHVFSVTLEEVGGAWVAGHLPFRRDLAFMLGLGLVSLLGFFVGRLGNALFTYPWLAGPAATREMDLKFMELLFLTAGLVMAVIVPAGLSAAWALVRAPYRVRLVRGGPRVEAAGPIPQSPLAPLNAFLKWFFKAFFDLYVQRESGS